LNYARSLQPKATKRLGVLQDVCVGADPQINTDEHR